MAQTTSIPKGTRDFSPLQMRRRQYIFETIRKVFALHAYLPIETPAMENLDTLMGKYGEEGDKLLFKILNSGDFWAKAAGTPWDEVGAVERTVKLGNRISEKGLRYDLTVPFARFVVQAFLTELIGESGKIARLKSLRIDIPHEVAGIEDLEEELIPLLAVFSHEC